MMFYKETKFKETPIGRIPKDWDVVKIKEVANVRGGKRVPKGEKFEDKKTPYPYIRVVDFKNMTVDTANLKYLPPRIYSYIKRYTISSNDVYISIAGTIGLAGLVPKELDGANLTENAAKLCSLKGVTKEFLAYTLNSRMAQGQIAVYIGKAQQPKLALFRIEKIRIPLPLSIEEQQKITEMLSLVDNAIEKTNEIIAMTERLKNGLMQELLTKGMGHKEFKDTEIGRIPKRWNIVKLKDAVTYEKGMKPKTLLNQEEQDTLPYLTADVIRMGAFTQWAKETGEFVKVRKDDVILIWDGFYCGDAFIGLEGILSSTMIKIEAKLSLDNHFLFYLLKTHFRELNTKISGMYLKHVNKSVFQNLKLPLPPLPEQQKIAEILSTVDKKLELERNEKAKLERIKQGLMDLLLTGKIRVKVN